MNLQNKCLLKLAVTTVNIKASIHCLYETVSDWLSLNIK